MRSFAAFAFVFLASLAPSFEASGKAPAAAEPVPLVMQDTGVADVDAVFDGADAPLATITNVRIEMSGLRTNVTSAMGLPEGTPFADAMADLKAKAGDQINLAVDERGLPRLEAEDGCPDNLKAAANAVNAGLGHVETALARLADVPGQLSAVASSAASIKPTSFTGVKATEVPKKTATVKNNVKVLESAKIEADAMVTELSGIKETVRSTFAKT